MVVMSMKKSEYNEKKERQMAITENILLHGVIDLIKLWDSEIETTVNSDGVSDEFLENEIAIYHSHISDLRDLLEKVEPYYKL